jgi:hypothetical protein
MTPLATALVARVAVTAAIALGTLTTSPHQANAFGLRTKMACAGDYWANCSAHSPDSPETRSCMRAVGAGLSRGCVDALVAEGEVSASEVNRRRSAASTASAN